MFFLAKYRIILSALFYALAVILVSCQTASKCSVKSNSVQDSFLGNECKWDQDSNSFGSISVQNGLLVIENYFSPLLLFSYPIELDNQIRTWDGIKVAIDANLNFATEETKIGLMCQTQLGIQEAYYGFVNKTGYYELGFYGLNPMSPNPNFNSISYGQISSHILNPSTSTITLSLECSNNHIKLYVNNEFVEEIIDNRLRKGGIAVFTLTEKGKSLVEFNNFGLIKID